MTEMPDDSQFDAWLLQAAGGSQPALDQLAEVFHANLKRIVGRWRLAEPNNHRITSHTGTVVQTAYMSFMDALKEILHDPNIPRLAPVYRSLLHTHAGWALSNVLKTIDRADRLHARLSTLNLRPGGDDDVDEPSELVMRAEVAGRVREGLVLLPEADRQLLVLHYFEGHSHRAIGAMLGKSQSAVRDGLARARNRMRALLGDGASLGGWGEEDLDDE